MQVLHSPPAPMDSQLTLVVTAPTRRLLFNTDSMKNATLFLDFASVPAYTISTDSKNSCTELRAASTGELLARITRKDVLPDTIAFPQVDGGTEMRMSKWLRKTALPDGSPAHVMDTEHGKYFLKSNPVHRLALFSEHELETPVAHWEHRDDTLPPVLVIQSGSTAWGATQPQIIAAFIVREFKLRMTEKASERSLVPVATRG
ncbi:hypothetical protein FB451DRAFT_1228389 [Mycena latifolia]|nr:hypothetical protein FB451DRAFT_1228389 [Mycena latifolia]